MMFRNVLSLLAVSFFSLGYCRDPLVAHPVEDFVNEKDNLVHSASNDYDYNDNIDNRKLNEVIDFSSGDFADFCDALEEAIPKDSVASRDVCDCVQETETVDFNCGIDNACISSNGGDAMQGDYSLKISREIQGASFAVNTAITACFTYPSDLYDGKEVCFSTDSDGLGVSNQCVISVGGTEGGNNNTCWTCRYCAGRRLTFNCTNLGYEDRSTCVDDNANNTLLRFLYEPEIVDTCPGSGNNGGGGGGSAANTTFVGFGMLFWILGITISGLFYQSSSSWMV